MTAVMDEATGQVILHNTTYKRKKWFLQSVNHRRKPMNQAVSADLPTGNKARIAYLHCIKDGKKLDPAMGSGHVLVYAFDVLMQLYEAEGESPRQAVELILENNLYGVDIDKRAFQLAYFALMMKGRGYSRGFFRKGIRPKVYDVPDNFGLEESDLALVPLETFPNQKQAETDLAKLIETFKLGNEVGALLTFDGVDFENLLIGFREREAGQQRFYWEKLRELVEVGQVLGGKYHVCVTNPPYLNKMSVKLDKYVKEHFKDVKTDLFSVFVKRNMEMLEENGYAGFMTPFVWMFIKSYEKLREYLINEKSISSLIQMEYSAFEEATVPVCTFTIKNTKHEKVGNYFRLSDFRGGMQVQNEKVLEGIANPEVDYFYQTNQENFKKIPGSPISFWVSENIYTLFSSNTKLDSIATARKGMSTGNNDIMLRNWFEISYEKISFDSKTVTSFDNSGKKYAPYNKGGGFRNWYGNLDLVIAYDNQARQLLQTFRGFRHDGNQYYFKEGITYSTLTSGRFNARYSTKGFLFDNKGSKIFCVHEEDVFYLLAFLCSNLVNDFLKFLCPTLDFNVGQLHSLPLIIKRKETIEVLAKENINISKSEWDSFETSWDFKKHPLI